jgi:hypothetical protein
MLYFLPYDTFEWKRVHNQELLATLRNSFHRYMARIGAKETVVSMRHAHDAKREQVMGSAWISANTPGLSQYAWCRWLQFFPNEVCWVCNDKATGVDLRSESERLDIVTMLVLPICLKLDCQRASKTYFKKMLGKVHAHACMTCKSWLNDKPLKCADCKQAFYCSRDCFVKDWPLHKTWCKKAVAVNQ